MLARRERERAAVADAEVKERINRCTFVFSSVGVVVLPFPLVVAALGAVVRVADGKGGGPSSLWSRLWPLWMALAYLLASGMWVCFLRLARSRAGPLLRTQYAQHAGPFKGFMKDPLADSPRAIAHGCTMFIFALLAPVALTMRASGDVDMPWSVAMLPLWIVFSLFVCAPLCRWRLRDEPGIFLSILGVLWLPLLVTLILLAVRLDGANVHLAWVFFPIWLFGCCTCTGATGGSVFSAIRAHRQNTRCAHASPRSGGDGGRGRPGRRLPRTSRLPRSPTHPSRSDFIAAIVFFVVFMLLFAPPIATFILLSVRDSGDSGISWTAAFFPTIVCLVRVATPPRPPRRHADHGSHRRTYQGLLSAVSAALGVMVCIKRFKVRRFQVSDSERQGVYLPV